MVLSPSQKEAVRVRAGNCCEYCRLPESASFARFHIDHIKALKHGGTNDTDNLCLACPKCNAYKGTNVAALDPLTDDATKLYNPRVQQWSDHFQINADATLTGQTPKGRVTLDVLCINDKDRVKQRFTELTADDYPC